MNKYSIQREDVGDEDRAIYVFDVYLGNQFVASFSLESEAQAFVTNREKKNPIAFE